MISRGITYAEYLEEMQHGSQPKKKKHWWNF